MERFRKPGELHVYIAEDRISRTVAIFIENEGPAVVTNYRYDSDQKQWMAEDRKADQCGMGEVKPFAEMPSGIFKALMSAMVKYNENNHVFTEREDVLKGKHEATKEHLMDAIGVRNKLMDLVETMSRDTSNRLERVTAADIAAIKRGEE